MAKKTVKKPSLPGKAIRSAVPTRNVKKKPAAPTAKAVARPAKKPIQKLIERPAAKTPAKIAVPVKMAAKRPDKSPEKSPAKNPEKSKTEASPRPAVIAASRNGSSAPPAPPIPTFVPQALSSNGKPKKSQAGFSARELDHFRDLLLAKRRELIGDMSSMEREALRVGGGSNLSNLPIHMADMGTDNYEQEFTLGLVQKERDLLKEINLSLAKIQNGTYGLCEGTQLPILKERLEYQPWARYSVDHQRKMERHGR